MSPSTIARTAPTFEDERTELETMRREAERMRRETQALADHTLDLIAAGTKAMSAGLRALEGLGQVSERTRAVTIPPAQRKRPARLAPDRA